MDIRESGARKCSASSFCEASEMTTRKSTIDPPIARPADAVGTALIPAPNGVLSPYHDRLMDQHATVSSAVITTRQVRVGRPFAPGKSGNPKGRPRGARNKLTETFLEVVSKDFREHGADAIARLRKRDPSTYLRIVAAIVPRSLILKRESEFDYSALTDQEIVELLQQRQRRKAIEAALKATE
jgi:hypothetical protein